MVVHTLSPSTQEPEAVNLRPVSTTERVPSQPEPGTEKPRVEKSKKKRERKETKS